jgi:hypothetical protein
MEIGYNKFKIMTTISFQDLQISIGSSSNYDSYSVTAAESSLGSISAEQFSPVAFANEIKKQDNLLEFEAVNHETLHNALKSIYDKVKLDNCTVQEAIDSLGYSHITDVISAYVTESHSAEEFAELAEAHLHVFRH